MRDAGVVHLRKRPCLVNDHVDALKVVRGHVHKQRGQAVLSAQLRTHGVQELVGRGRFRSDRVVAAAVAVSTVIVVIVVTVPVLLKQVRA